MEQQHLHQSSLGLVAPSHIGTSGLAGHKCLFPSKKKKSGNVSLHTGTTDGTFPGSVKLVSHIRQWKTRGGGGIFQGLQLVPVVLLLPFSFFLRGSQAD